MPTEQQDFARKLRRQSTKSEDLLWDRLRNRRLDGAKFRRQAPFLAYTVDFLCFEHKLIIELDGRQHASERDYDAARTEEIERHGFKVLRFANEEVLNNLDVVITKIRQALGAAMG